MQTIVNLSLLRCFTFDLSAMQSYQSIVSISQWYSYEIFCIDSILLSNNAVVYQNILIKWSKCDQMRLSFIFIFPLKWRRFRWVLPSKFWHNFIIFLVLRFNPSVYGTCWIFFNLRNSVIKWHQKRWKKHSTHFWLWVICWQICWKRKYYEAIRAYAALVCSFYMSYHQILGANQTFISFNWLNNIGQLDLILFSIWIMDLFDYIIENSIYFNPIYELFDHIWQINEILGWI